MQVAQSKTVLVTGGGRGIGAATVRRFARAGWRVLLTYRREAETAAALVGEIGQEGGKAAAYACDLADEAQIVGLFRRIDEDGHRLDALVNNAGVTGDLTRLADLDGDSLREIVAVNLTGTILCAREAVRRMSRVSEGRGGGQGGAIVNISSTATHKGSPDEWVHYAATKGAVDVFTKGLAREVAADGIRVNAVAPGLILANPALKATVYERMARMKSDFPMDRPGRPEEVAEAVFWLCAGPASGAPDFVTGAVLPVSGGR